MEKPILELLERCESNELLTTPVHTEVVPHYTIQETRSVGKNNMDRKSAAIAVLLGLSPTGLATAQEPKVELVCNGTFSFMSIQGKWTEIESNGVYLRIFPRAVRIAGGIGALSDTIVPISKENEAEINFAGDVSGVINRFSGKFTAYRQKEGSDKMDFLYDAYCALPRPIF